MYVYFLYETGCMYYVEERQMTLFIIGLVQLAYFFSASFVKVKQVTPTGLPLSSFPRRRGGDSATHLWTRISGYCFTRSQE